MSKRIAIAIAVISAGSGVIAGHMLWRPPPTPQQVKVEQQKCERLLARTQREAPVAASPTETWEPSRLESEFSEAVAITNSRERDEKISAIFEHVDPAHAPELAAAIAKEMPSQANNMVLMQLIDKWTEIDPEAALKFTSALPNSQVRESMIMSCFMRLVDDDPASAESYITALPTRGQLYSSLTSTLIDKMVQDDPAKALEFVAKLPPGVQVNESAHVYSVWALSDPESASAAALKLPKGNARSQAVSGAMSMWVSQDPTAALDFAAKQDDKQIFVEAMRQAAGSTAADNPDLVASYLDKVPAGSKRDDMLESLASQWASSDLANAKAWAMSLRDNDERDKAIAGLVQGNSYFSGGDSTSLLAEIRNPQMRARAAVAACTTLAQDDPNAGLRCADEHSTKRERENIIEQVVARWADTDPRAAADAMGQMKDPPQQALDAIGRNWAAIDPRAALQWAEGLPAGDKRTSAIAEMLSTWADVDPQAAADRADRENNTQAIAETAHAWAQNDPQAAMDWLQSRRSKVGRDDAIETVLGVWSDTDQKRALAWANDLPHGDLKNRSLQELARRMVYENPESAASTIMNMSGQARTEALADLYGTWNANDAEGAAAWLARARLSDRERRAMTTPEAHDDDEQQHDVPNAPGCVCPPNN